MNRSIWLRSDPRLAHLTLACLALLMVLVTSPGATSYANNQGQVLDNATSCGDSKGCHGSHNPGTTLFIEGPEELEVNEVGYYNLTLVGGPGDSYGFYIIVTNSNGISKSISGDLLVPLTTNQVLNVTQDRPYPYNFISFNMTAPKYAGHFIIHAAYNSANDDGLNSSADEWNSATFDVQVVYPHEVVGWETFYLGLGALFFAAVSVTAFRALRIKLKG